MKASAAISPVATPKSDEPIRPARSSYSGFLDIGMAAFFWGVSASLGRAAFTGRFFPNSGISSVDPLILSQCRTTFSFLAVALWMVPRRGLTRLRLRWSDFGRLFWLGIAGVAASNYFYYVAIQRTGVATAIIVQYTAPVWVLLYMVARGAERLTISKAASVILAITGIGLVIGLFGQRQFELDRIGVGAALVAALSFSIYNVSGHYVLARYDRWTVLLYSTLAASLFWTFINPPHKILAAHYSAAAWLFLGLFSFLSVLVPFAFYFAGLERLPPTKAIIASCLEPVFSILIAAIALKEVIGPWQALGVAMVLSAIVVVERPARGEVRRIAGPVD